MIYRYRKEIYMYGRDIIKEIMSKQGVGLTEMARRLGYKSAANVNNLLNRQEEEAKDLSIGNLCRYAEVLGYEVVIRKAGRKVKEGEYKIG